MIRQSWWKILGVVMFIYVLLFGFLTPLKPGIATVSPITIPSGGELYLDITSYNTRYLDAKELRVWLKIDSLHIIASKKVTIESDNQVKAQFTIPAHLPTNALSASTDLIVDSDSDGYALLPNAVFVSQDKKQINNVAGSQLWQSAAITDIHQPTGIKFPYRNILNESVRNLFFHVAIWFAMFALLIGALYYSIMYLRKANRLHDIYASSLTSVAIVYGLIGMATGSFWAKYTWGQFWINDVKLNMSAVALLIYLAYWILRSSMKDQDQRARISAAYSIFAFAALIPLLFVIPRLTDSMHPGNGGNPALSEDDMDNTLRFAFYPAIISMTLIGIWISTLAIRFEVIKESFYLKKARHQ